MSDKLSLWGALIQDALPAELPQPWQCSALKMILSIQNKIQKYAFCVIFSFFYLGRMSRKKPLFAAIRFFFKAVVTSCGRLDETIRLLPVRAVTRKSSIVSWLRQSFNLLENQTFYIIWPTAKRRLFRVVGNMPANILQSWSLDSFREVVSSNPSSDRKLSHTFSVKILMLYLCYEKSVEKHGSSSIKNSVRLYQSYYIR